MRVKKRGLSWTRRVQFFKRRSSSSYFGSRFFKFGGEKNENWKLKIEKWKWRTWEWVGAERLGVGKPLPTWSQVLSFFFLFFPGHSFFVDADFGARFPLFLGLGLAYFRFHNVHGFGLACFEAICRPQLKWVNGTIIWLLPRNGTIISFDVKNNYLTR